MSGKNHSAEKEAFWRLAVEEFCSSGLSVRAFCRREGLSEPSFYAWRRTLQERDRIATMEATPSNGNANETLVPVTVTRDESPSDEPHSDQTSPLEIVTPSGFTLRFPADLDPRQLGALLNAIAPGRGAPSSGAAPC